MPPELLNLLTAAWEALRWGVLHPAAGAVVGGFAAGFAIGAAKNRTAFAELGRGLLSGAFAWGVIWAAQRFLEGGAS